MGNKWSHQANQKLGQTSSCPTCNKSFSASTTYTTFNNHLDMCLQQQQPQIQAPIPQPIPQPVISSIGEHYIWLKQDGKWTRTKSTVQGGVIQNFTIQQIQNASFAEKQVWLRIQLEKKRIPWQLGSDKLQIDLNQLLQSSYTSIQGINMHKEVKIHFLKDKVQDAGGLLREWLTLILKEFVKCDLLQLTETENVYYKINNISNYHTVLGVAIGKAIFERMPLSLEFDRPFLRRLLGQEVELDDIQYYDKSLYQSWKYLINNTFDPDELLNYFVICIGQDCIELKENGSEILVTNENKMEYVKLAINYYTYEHIRTQLHSIQSPLYNIVPQEYLKMLKIDEFEMILYGVPFIDLNEWKEQTIYDAPYPNHITIWFWNVLKEFDQDQLKKFLHYCTGSYRIPVNGFSKLESNRGQYAKFKIIQIPYKDQNSFPIAHTCFNRLELPRYPNEAQLRKSLRALVLNDLEGIFGME